MGKLKRECDNYAHSGVKFKMKDDEKSNHTIKKFEFVSEHRKSWVHKILGYS